MIMGGNLDNEIISLFSNMPKRGSVDVSIDMNAAARKVNPRTNTAGFHRIAKEKRNLPIDYTLFVACISLSKLLFLFIILFRIKY